jgi:APA family basic amino acid/polyamine antiporter
MTQRTLGPGTAATAVAASMVGTGVFTTTGYLLQDIGSPVAVLLCWVLGGIVSLAGALCYAELGAAIPLNGGEYTLLGRIWDPALGFAAAMISLVVGFAAPIAGAGIAFGRYVHAAWPALPLDERVLAVGLVLFCAALHAARVHAGAAFLNTLTVLQMGAVALVAVLGLALGDLSHLSQGAPVGSAVASPSFAVGLVIVGYSYAGWNAAAYLAGELRDPGRSLPLGLVAGTLFVTTLYVGLNAGILLAAPPEQLAGKLEVAHTAAVALLGEPAGVVLSALVAQGLAGCVLALLLTGSRVAEALGRDHAALRWLAHRRPGGGPGVALALLTAISAVIGALAAFDWLLEWVGFVLSANAMLTVLGLPWLRVREPHLPRPFRVPAAGLVVALFVLPTLWSMLHTLIQRPSAGLAGLATLGLCAVPWFLVRDTH